MRLKLLTNLITLLLVTVCLALGATLWWSQRALERPYQLMEQYLELAQRFRGEVADNVQGYLASGDALRHSAASQGIDSLEQRLDQLPDDLADDLRPSFNELREFTRGELLAAGKLAGDPQGLLIQAEREIAGALDQLARYADESASPTAADYRAPLFIGAQHLNRLSQARAKLVESGRDELAVDVERELEALTRDSAALDALPLLGVADSGASAADDFAAMMGLESQGETSQAEDRGIALKRELSGLLKRYPGELARTRELIQRRVELARATAHRLEALQGALAALEPRVRAEHGRIQGEVRLIQGLMIGLILLLALGIDRIQRRLTQVLGHLVKALGAWAAGDFSRPMALGSNTLDLRRIEESLNRLRDYLGELVGTIRQHAEQVAGSSTTLTHLNNGLHASAEDQAGGTAQIRDALGELEATIQQVAGDASLAADASRDAGRAVEQGQGVIDQSLAGLHQLVGEVQNNAQAVERLAEETETIDKVLTVIRGIAEQTNLLALNAAIEAARAGEMGRGFAVVADEVRNLARRVQDSTDEITSMINTLQAGTRDAVEFMRESSLKADDCVQAAHDAGTALAAITGAVAQMRESNTQIAVAAEQQSQVAEEMTRAVVGIRDVTELTVSQTVESASTSTQLAELASELSHAIRQLKLRA